MSRSSPTNALALAACRCPHSVPAQNHVTRQRMMTVIVASPRTVCQSPSRPRMKRRRGYGKPLRALARIGMQRMGCLFSVEVVAIQGLPASMNGLRLSVTVRKKGTKEGAVQTMPARVLQGSADFEETLFVRCHVYCSGKPPKFEPHPFLISAVAIDAPELDFGRSSVDLSSMVKESMERNSEGVRIRQWDAAFPLAGKAKGGEMVVKLGFQIMEDGGVEIYKQGEGARPSKNRAGDSPSSSSFARRQSKSSFSVSSPKITRSEPSRTPIKESASMDLRGIDDFNLDEPGPSPPPTVSSTSIQKLEPEQKQEDLDLPLFEVIDKGVEVQEQKKEEEEVEAKSESAIDEASVSSEVVKEVVHDSAHMTRLTELDAIAKQIKALESMMAVDATIDSSIKTDQEDGNKQLDAEEETVTREFLQMLELEGGKRLGFDSSDLATPMRPEAGDGEDSEAKCFLSDLGKGLGAVVQTRDGGYLTAMNPFDTKVSRKETPKLAMQVSRPFIINDQKLGSGIEVFQKLAAVGTEGLSSKLDSLTAMDELMGKTAEQIAFEGIASAIISGRSTGGASSSAAKSVTALKIMSSAMSHGRKERISTGIWNVKEEPLGVEDILPFSLQKIEAMAIEALKIQAEVTDEEPPFDVSPLVGTSTPLDSAMSLDEWVKSSDNNASAVTMLVVACSCGPVYGGTRR
ncbi:uncharacterized protein A4U43_C01F10340 [Asparagus officinalis]|uniref:C2 NT-type domain-containing protein n=1 Tax=Asparagus officinalis TaxID=4686 RepID=A0A5P1FP61_ASPOF|nr:uncharacterized protein A4U43_C01F10340 [Asparagus officinalis]